jgi:multidrug efflux pump subunit AcrB
MREHSILQGFREGNNDSTRLVWKPLCYAQIGGLAVATLITLLLVPVFYSILYSI